MREIEFEPSELLKSVAKTVGRLFGSFITMTSSEKETQFKNTEGPLSVKSDKIYQPLWEGLHQGFSNVRAKFECGQVFVHMGHMLMKDVHEEFPDIKKEMD